MIHGDVLGERARLSPDRTALVLADSGRRLTYRELDARARRLARAFLGPLGLSPGDRLGLLAHNRLEFLDAFFAAGKSGVVLVPLGTRLHPRELAPIVADAGLSALLYDGALSEVAEALRGAVPRLVALDEPAPGDLALGALVAGAGGDTPLPPRSPEDLYALLYTSGTTGRPKGVRIPHRMVGWNGVNTALAWQLGEDDVSPVFTPLYHAGGLGAFLVPILAAGGTIVLHPRFDAVDVWRAIERERATVVLGVPTIWKMLLECPEIDRVDLSSIRWLISGGAPLPLPLLAAYQARGLVLKQGYGMTEVGVNCFAMSSQEATRKAGSIGRPLPFTRARVVAEDGRPLPPGEVGELCLAGPHVCQGYWNDPEATRAVLDAEGFFHTGDLARQDAEGFFTIAGRKKDMLISGGVNVYPAEIEAVLLGHDGVAEVSVVGVADPTWGEVGVAFVVARHGAALTPEGLAAFAAERLSRMKLPKAFVLVDSLPLTPYGKVVKGELRRRWESEA